jgi:WD40 repeat protein
VSNGDGRGVWYNSIDVSPDGTRCVIGYGNKDFTDIIDLKTGGTIQTIPLKGVLCRYSKDGSKILINQGWKKATNIWDLASNSSILEIDTKDFYPEWNLNESKIVFGAHSDQQSAVLDIESGEITTFDYDHPITTGASFSPDGNRILTHSHLEGSFYLWNLNTKQLDVTLNYSERVSSNNQSGDTWSHPAAIGSFTPDGSKIITIAPNLTVQLWDTTSGDVLQTKSITETVLEFSKPVFSDDGRRILIPLRDGKCYIGELPENYSSLPSFGPAIPITKGYAYLANNGKIRPLFLPQRGITSSKLLRSTNEILIGTDKGEIKVFNTSSGQKIGPTIRHEGKIVSVDESNEASMVATSSDVGSVKVWDKKNPKEPILAIGIPTPDEKLDKQNIYFGSEGKTIWIHSNRGTECWSLSSKEKIYEWKKSWHGKVSRKSRDGMQSIAANKTSVRIFDMNDGKMPSSIGLEVGSPITDFLISNHKKFVAVSSEDNFLRIWDSIDQTDPKFELEFDSVVNSLEHVQGSNLIIAGCASGRIYIIDQDKGIFTDHLKMQGQGPCVEIITNSLGHIAAIFKTSNGAHSAAFELSTGRPLTGALNNGTNVTEIKFTHDETQIICLPSDQEGDNELIDYHNDVATVWPILISEGKPINSDLPKIITALGGLKLNPDGITVEDNSLEELKVSVRKLENPSMTGKFFKWLLEFPGSRGDSPFRDPASKKYTDALSQQNNLILLQENLRLRREDALAITRNAIYELVINGENNPSVIESSLSELEKARSLNDENPEILYYSAIAFEYAGDIKLAASYYDLATKAEPLSNSAILNIIDAQNQLSVSNQQRLLLLSKAIDQSESESEKAALIIDKFNFCVGERFYNEIDELWAVIKDWDVLPTTISPKSVLEKYISVKEAQASELANQSEYKKAIELLKPAAIASLTTNQNSISSSVANLIEWENIDNQAVLIIEPDAPWKYQDNGVDQGDDWRQSNFDDRNWKEGSGKFGYGGDGETTKLSWGDDRNNKVTTYYFRHTFNIDESSKRPFLVADLIKDDGVVIYLNGKEVIRNSMPLGDIDFSSFSATTAWEHNNNGPEKNELFVHRHVIPEESLKLGRNVIAAELHQCNKGSSDLGFQFELYGSNQTPIDYINEITNGTEGSSLMSAVEDLIPRQIREEKFIAINIALGNISREAVVDIDLETLVAGFKIAEKLGTNDVILEFSDIAVQALEENPTPENLTKRVELLNIKMNLLRKTGLNKQAISDLVDIIVSPPRAENLPTELIDLSAYYNAGLFHYSSWHADSERFDLRFLPEKYDGPIDFDLRGIIQLNSGLDDDGKTANDYRHVLNNYKKYPTSVKNIEINSKAQKAHFLVGAIFGNEATTGKTAITVVFNYSDGSKSEMEIKAQQDIFDWWAVGNADKIPNENIGFLGENNLGNERFLQKPVWINPHPEKVISHIDLNSGLIKMAPFVVAITFE